MGRNNLDGAWGEMQAGIYLRKKRYKLLAQGYKCRFGEIDLIAANSKHLVFVEVKTRKNADFAQAQEFVDMRKQARIRTTAEMYLSQNPTKLQPRFDVIEVYAPQGYETKNPSINHIEGAFE